MQDYNENTRTTSFEVYKNEEESPCYVFQTLEEAVSMSDTLMSDVHRVPLMIKSITVKKFIRGFDRHGRWRVDHEEVYHDNDLHIGAV